MPNRLIADGRDYVRWTTRPLWPQGLLVRTVQACPGPLRACGKAPSCATASRITAEWINRPSGLWVNARSAEPDPWEGEPRQILPRRAGIRIPGAAHHHHPQRHPADGWAVAAGLEKRSGGQKSVNTAGWRTVPPPPDWKAARLAHAGCSATSPHQPVRQPRHLRRKTRCHRKAARRQAAEQSLMQ